MTVAVSSSETSVIVYQTTWCYISEDKHINNSQLIWGCATGVCWETIW